MIKDMPSTLPAAIKMIKNEQAKVESLKESIRYDLLPAWVIQDVLDENEALKAELRNILRKIGA